MNPSKEMGKGDIDRKGATFHLPTYYYIVETVGVTVPILSALGMVLAPQYFQWLTFPINGMAGILFIFGFINAAFLISHELTGNDIFFTANRYMFVVLYILIILGTGGLDSSFTIVLVFPLIVSAVYLDRKTTRNVGIFLTTLYLLVVFMPATEPLTGSAIAKHTILTSLLGIISFMMYRIVMETMHAKYEKDQAAKRLSELVQVDKIKSDFLSVAQHRLRTPLAGARFALETVSEESGLSSSTKEVVNDGLKRIKDSIEIVNEMLKTAEDQEGNKLALIFTEVEVSKMLRDITDELSFVASKNNDTVMIDISEKITISADREKLHAALTNIIDNACRYTHHGKVSVSLQSGNPIVITVADTGMGIAESDMPYVFERLHRGRNAIHIDPDESGVGLYISKKVIELHGGSINIESRLNVGTTVIIRLPVAHDANTPAT